MARSTKAFKVTVFLLLFGHYLRVSPIVLTARSKAAVEAAGAPSGGVSSNCNSSSYYFFGMLIMHRYHGTCGTDVAALALV